MRDYKPKIHYNTVKLFCEVLLCHNYSVTLLSKTLRRTRIDFKRRFKVS